MHEDTGELLSLSEVKKKPLDEQKKFIEIPEVFLSEIQGMNRHQRRKWLSQNKKRIEQYKSHAQNRTIQNLG